MRFSKYLWIKDAIQRTPIENMVYFQYRLEI